MKTMNDDYDALRKRSISAQFKRKMVIQKLLSYIFLRLSPFFKYDS